MALPTYIAFGKDQIMWAAVETAPGTVNFPVAAGTIQVTSDIDVNQIVMKAADKQKRNTLGRIEELRGPYEPGKIGFSTYIKPSGALGTAPAEGDLLRALFGIETVTGATSVVYTQSGITVAPVTLTLLIKRGFFSYLCTGCIIKQGVFAIKADGSDDAWGGAVWTAECMKVVQAGQLTLDGAHDGTGVPITEITVNEYAEIDEVGAKITIGTDDNTGSGFTITAVNAATKVITFTPACATLQADDALVYPYVPAIVESGYIQHGRYGAFSENRAAAGVAARDIVEATVTYVNPYVIATNVKTNTAYPEQVLTSDGSDREITVDWSFYIAATEGYQRYDAAQGTDYALSIPVGDTAAYRYVFAIPKVEIETPNESGDGARTMELTGKGLETAATLNNAISLTFA